MTEEPSGSARLPVQMSIANGVCTGEVGKVVVVGWVTRW